MIARTQQPVERPVHRRGAVIVESAFVLGVFLTMLLGCLDLSLAILRENTLAEAARRLARAGIVHGSEASAVNTVWGPDTYEGRADEDSEMADTFRDILFVVDPADVNFRIVWPDGENRAGDRIEVSLTSEYRPVVASLFGSGPYELQSTSTMHIEH